ncbi:hypothetical protein HY345_01135 [Candidatus Microgenomates bacterium]|nr:hypothetical protein [Candidatus Microgenomates bacterium]
MYRISSLGYLLGIHLLSVLIAFCNAWLFTNVIGPRIPSELEVYSNTVALTLGVIWLFFSTSIWLRTDEETKLTAEAIDKKDKAMFLTQASKRLSPGIWLLYFEITVLTLLGFDLFHVESEGMMAGMIINLLISFLVSLTFIINYDSDDSLTGMIVVYNTQKIPREWLNELERIFGKNKI